MIPPLVETMGAFGLAGAVSFAAWRIRSLTANGAIAAAICGALALLAGWDWAIVLITYFISATAVSKIGAKSSEFKRRMLESVVEKGGTRDSWQVFANGGVFAVMALAWTIHPHAFVALAGLSALATSAADTFATEIGTLSRSAPRSIRTGKTVSPGTSGGVTIAGLTGALVGAVGVCATAMFTGWPLPLTLAALTGGLIGMLADSFIGATLQAQRYCAQCDASTEQTVHTWCGSQTELTGGIRWINNDTVNFFATIAGTVFGVLCYFWWTLNFTI